MKWRDLPPGLPLEWVQPRALKMDYELRSGDEVIATLRFRSSFGSFATGENADGCWTFKRVGFLQTRATIRVCGSDEEIATFKNNTWTGGGTLELRDGRKFPATTNFWQTRLELQDASGQSLIQLKNAAIVRARSTVEIQPNALTVPETPWMTIFGWYLVVLMRRDSSA